MKILPIGAELYRTDGQTDITKLTVAFLNFVKESKNRIRQDTLYQFQLKFTQGSQSSLKIWQ